MYIQDQGGKSIHTRILTEGIVGSGADITIINGTC